MTESRIYLSPPGVGTSDRAAVDRAFAGGWIAPLGPEVDAFEEELAKARRAIGLASALTARGEDPTAESTPNGSHDAELEKAWAKKHAEISELELETVSQRAELALLQEEIEKAQTEKDKLDAAIEISRGVLEDVEIQSGETQASIEDRTEQIDTATRELERLKSECDVLHKRAETATKELGAGGGVPGYGYARRDPAREDPIRALYWYELLANQSRWFDSVDANSQRVGRLAAKRLRGDLFEAERARVATALAAFDATRAPPVNASCLRTPRGLVPSVPSG